MKKKFQKILAGSLAVIMVLTSFAFDFGDATEAKAAEEVYENVLAGDVLADVDFTETNIYDLDDKFVATEGTTDSVYKYWKSGEVGTTAETTNVAQYGTVDMESMAFLVNSQSWYTEALLVDGDKNTTSNAYVSTENHTTDEGPETITVTFPNETYYMLSKVCFTTNGAY
ncbi:MAG: hypothetical protein IJE23_03005, partial [Tyzzerella sp.]|nr:hypothetical protein [Tyzzerella sp.]